MLAEERLTRVRGDLEIRWDTMLRYIVVLWREVSSDSESLQP